MPYSVVVAVVVVVVLVVIVVVVVVIVTNGLVIKLLRSRFVPLTRLDVSSATLNAM